ncbi:hypothetical protein QTP88_007847 [Uroleucon formosanum]
MITETHFTNNSYFFIPGYKLINTNHPENTAHGGVAIFIKSSLEFQELPSFRLDYLQSCALTIKLNFTPFTIAAIYSPTKHKITTQKLTDYFNTIQQDNFIIGGDYNAKHQFWGCRANNPRGLILYNFVKNNNFKVLAPPGPTYWPTSLRKNPDILDIFVTKIPNRIHTTTENLLDLNSDHSSILLTVNTYPPIRPQPPKLFYSHTNKLLFHNLVQQEIKLNVKLKSTDDIDLAINDLTNCIQTAAWASTNPNELPKVTNLTPHNIRVIIAEKRRLRAQYQRTRLPSDKHKYNKLANKLKKTLIKHKLESLHNHLSNLSNKDGSLWKATKQALKYKSSNIPIKKDNGTHASKDSEKVELFKTHLHNTFQPHDNIINFDNINTVNQFLDTPFPLSTPVKHFSPNDVKYIIQKYPNRKSPGFDLINAEVAKYLPKKAIIHLTHIFNAILRLSYFPTVWKFSSIILFLKPNKPPDLATSYRPISLLPFFAKILEKLILKRILPSISENKILPDHQFGFRQSHSTIHQAHRIVDAISFSLEKKLYCTCVFLDVSQAFDKVWHHGLLFKLKQFLHPSYYLLIKSYLTNRNFRVSYGSSVSSIASINAGVPQGGILSPILYNIYASDQPTTPHTLTAEYADDKAIISINADPLIASRNLQNHLHLMEKWYTNWRVKVNQDKSFHTTFTLKQTPCPNVNLYGIQIPHSQTVKYLGLILDRRLTWAPHIKSKRLQLNNRLRTLSSLLHRNTHTNLSIKLIIYKALLKPIWTYGLQLWGSAKKSNIQKIQAFQNITLRKITNAPPFVSNLTLHNDLRITTVLDEAKCYYKRFHTKLPLHPNPLIKKLSTLSIPVNALRSTGIKTTLQLKAMFDTMKRKTRKDKRSDRVNRYMHQPNSTITERENEVLVDLLTNKRYMDSNFDNQESG